MRRIRSRMVALAVAASAWSTLPQAAAERIDVLHDTNVVVDPTLVPDAEAVVYVETRGATALRKSHALARAQVEVAVQATGEDAPAPTALGTATTDDDGRALVRFKVPRLAPGRYRLQVATRSRHGGGSVERAIEIAESSHLHLRSDRPVYRPGQALRWRATLLSAANAHPLTDAAVEVVIKDPNGTAIWRGRETTDDAGMILGELALGDDLVLGKYTLEASARGARAQHAVQIKQFKLPPFDVKIETANAAALEPGGVVRGAITARYHYGEPVAGTVRFGADGGLSRTAELDANGRLEFELDVPSSRSALRIDARVTDGAGRHRDAQLALPLPSDDLRVEIVPESRTLIAGTRQWVTVITTDGQGELVPARVSLRVPDQRRIVKQSPGAVRIAVRTPAQPRSWPPFELQAEVSTADGRVAEHTVRLAVAASDHYLRPVRAVVPNQDAIAVNGRWPADAGPVVLTLVRDGAPLARTVVEPVDGELRGSVEPPPGLFGLFTVHATDLRWDPTNGRTEPRAATTTVFLLPKVLDVTIRGERRHAPGDIAKLAVEVRDPTGAALAGVGLAAAVVDERVLALGETPPDLITAIRELHAGKASAAGVAFATLLARADSKAKLLARRAILESLPPDPSPPEIVVAAADRLRRELERIAQAREPLVRHLVGAGTLGTRAGNTWRYRKPLDHYLAAIGWERARRRTPWQDPTTWSYAGSLDGSLGFDTLALEVADLRMNALVDALWSQRRRARRALHRDGDVGLAKLVERELIAAGLAVDPWGVPHRVVRTSHLDVRIINVSSAGPDGRFETDDDLLRQDVFRESELSSGYGFGSGVGYGGGGLGGRGASSPSIRMGSVGVPGRDEAKVRKRFDETVLWVTGVRTDANGRAELEVPLADSITGWQVAVEAVGGHGGVGSGSTRLETFLPVHVDADVPTALTDGDRYAIPVAIANHSGAEQAFEIRASVTGTATLLDGAVHRLMVGDGGARPAYVTVRATAAGEAVLHLSLSSGGRVIDRLERRIEVRAPGALVRELRSGRLSDGDGVIELSIPKDHATGSARATLTLFRGAADQALDGLEGMLQEPYGCFEQTSSATYPNLLVLDLLQGQRGTEALRKRARDLVGKGYQRLISYEVSGGGFSWFGESPANQVLTAYGLLEFADMSRVYPVDTALIERTRDWLVGKQQSDGSWKPDASWLHDWSAVQGKISTTAYVAWALAESGYRGPALQRALGYLRRNATSLRASPYLTALWAAAEASADTGDDRALTALAKASVRDADGMHFSANGATLFYGTGDSADVQVTALAIQALHRDGRSGDAAAGLEWLWGKRQPSYGWGTTQSTVLALRASAMTAAKQVAPTGRVRVELDGEPVGELDLEAPALPTLELANLTAGAHRVRLVGPNGVDLRADLRVRWRGTGAPEASARGLKVALELPQQEPRVGSLSELAVIVANAGDDEIAMPTVVVPVPPGFRVDPESLDQLARSRVVSRAEDRGSEIAFYMTELAPAADVRLPYRLEAVAACEVMQGPARAYAYYAPQTYGTSASHRLSAARRPPPRQ